MKNIFKSMKIIRLNKLLSRNKIDLFNFNFKDYQIKFQ